MMEQAENFSDDPQENLRIENEFLKIKLKAQYGEAFGMETSEQLPLEIENQFLRNMIAFEDEYAKADFTTIYDRIGRPVYKMIGEIRKFELNAALKELTDLLEKNSIGLDILDGPYPDEVIYRFIIEELFNMEIEKTMVAGMRTNFIYEEFHPNHKADIIKQTHAFLQSWFNREFTEHSTELSSNFITADGIQMTREDVIGAMNIFFEAFCDFKDDGYNIDSINFELQETGEGMGFAEGMLRYDAVMDNGEAIRYEGPYKLYMQLEDSWWTIFYFVMPGFKW